MADEGFPRVHPLIITTRNNRNNLPAAVRRSMGVLYSPHNFPANRVIKYNNLSVYCVLDIYGQSTDCF